MEVAGRHITVLGLGRHGGGIAVTRWLVGQGAQVSVTDLASADDLAESLAAIRDLPLAQLRLGGHDERDLLSADAIVVNPAVRPDSPYLRQARAAGISLTSEIELFLERCRSTVIGVTGSNGKSTTATMLADILRADSARSGRRAWLGGNIGVSLLDQLEAIQPADFVVLELSSFQLTHLSNAARWPSAAIVTGCTPNHLDWHPNFADYAAAKRRLIDNLPPGGLAVLNRRSPEIGRWQLARGRELTSWTDELPPLRVPGIHNRANAGQAAAMAAALGASTKAIATGLDKFQPLPHRYQDAGSVLGRRFIDDSKSTTPEATQAALQSTNGAKWLLIGGLGKGADFAPLINDLILEFDRESAEPACSKPACLKGVACYGTAGPQLAAKVLALKPSFNCSVEPDLARALLWCWQQSQAGDQILLSPACASLDQFRDYVDRGQHFRRWVATLAADTNSLPIKTLGERFDPCA